MASTSETSHATPVNYEPARCAHHSHRSQTRPAINRVIHELQFTADLLQSFRELYRVDASATCCHLLEHVAHQDRTVLLRDGVALQLGRQLHFHPPALRHQQQAAHAIIQAVHGVRDRQLRVAGLDALWSLQQQRQRPLHRAWAPAFHVDAHWLDHHRHAVALVHQPQPLRSAGLEPGSRPRVLDFCSRKLLRLPLGTQVGQYVTYCGAGERGHAGLSVEQQVTRLPRALRLGDGGQLRERVCSHLQPLERPMWHCVPGQVSGGHDVLLPCA
jgi:hypothetical protein